MCLTLLAPTVLLFRRRAPDSLGAVSARLAIAGREQFNAIQQENLMKYLLAILAALFVVGSANAATHSASCCGKDKCCSTGCCKK